MSAPAKLVLAQAGLMIVGLTASLWQTWNTRRRSWVVLTLLQLCAAAVTIVQLRGSFAGAMLAAPALGAIVTIARHRGALATLASWLLSGGLFYPVAAAALPAEAAQPIPGASCTAPDLIDALGELPTGTVMAPIDTAARAIASTNQPVIAGAYHRDGAGNVAMYSFYRGDADHARRIAEQWNVRWVIACDGFAGADAPLNGKLQQHVGPAWLHQVVQVPSGGAIFEVVDRPSSLTGKGHR